jgi:carboxymethylenebutenolidase
MSRRANGRAGDLSRRQVLVTALSSGFALAAQPVAAQTISTSSDGLEVGAVQIPTSFGEIPAYRAFPKQGKQHALVLVVQEIFGVHEHMRDVCRRLARRGYFAVAPELFARQGDVSKLSDIAEIRKIVALVPDAQVLSDLDACVAWASGTGRADASKLGITGFCWGGRITWLYAAHNPTLRAGVAWYGRVTGDKNHYTPQHPLDIAKQLTTPVLGLYGEEDQGIPVASVKEMEAALKDGSSAARRSQIKLYPQAGHAFFADYRPTYRKGPAEDGWKRMLGWFAANGVSGS